MMKSIDGLGLMTTEEMEQAMRFEIKDDILMDTTAKKPEGGTKYALLAAPAATVLLPAAAAAAM